MNRTPYRRAVSIVAVFLALLPLAGCGGDNVSNPSDNSLVKPKTGTQYFYNSIRYNDAGAVTFNSPDTFSIIATDVTVQGRAGLLALKTVLTRDTLYLRYEPNGDFSMLERVDSTNDGVDDAIRTRTFPVGSRKATLTGIDTLYDSSNSPTVHNDSLIFLGEEQITVPAGTFRTIKVGHLDDVRKYTPDWTLTSRVRELTTHYFAPSIGFFPKSTYQHERIDAAGALISRKTFNLLELTSYTLK